MSSLLALRRPLLRRCKALLAAASHGVEGVGPVRAALEALSLPAGSACALGRSVCISAWLASASLVPVAVQGAVLPGHVRHHT